MKNIVWGASRHGNMMSIDSVNVCDGVYLEEGEGGEQQVEVVVDVTRECGVGYVQSVEMLLTDGGRQRRDA